MTEKDNRPVNLNLLTISLPIIGLSSILHRISGLIIFLAFPLIVWLFSISLESEESFSYLQNQFQQLVVFKIIIFLLFIGFLYHVLAGIRKLLADTFGIGETLKSGNLISWVVFGLTFLISLAFFILIL